MTTKRVFVYGSLMRGLHNHRLLAGAEMLGRFVTGPHFTMYSMGAFPAVVPRGDTRVAGEVYEVDEVTLARLDLLEGHPDLYVRVPVSDRGGWWRGVEMYVMRPEQVVHRRVVPGADWRHWVWRQRERSWPCAS